MKRLLFLLVAVSMIGVLSGCGNSAPAIGSATPFPTCRVVSGSPPIDFSIDVTDPNGDPLSYFWSANSGSPTSGTNPTFTWTPPAAVGNYEVSVAVADGVSTVVHKWKVEVVSGPAYTVTGEIKSALTAVPITEQVNLIVDGVTHTVQGGVFTLENLPQGSHSFTLEAPGFLKYQNSVNITADRHLVIPLISVTEPVLDASWVNNYGGSNTYAVGVSTRGSYIFVGSTNKILKYTLSGTLAGTFASGLVGEFDFLTFDPSGFLWGVNNLGSVFKFDADGTVLLHYDGLVSSYVVWGLAVDDAYFYVSDVGTNKVKKYRKLDGSFVAEVSQAAGIPFSSPCQMAFGPDGNLYLTDFANGRIVVMSPTLTVRRTFTPSVEGEMVTPTPLALAFGPDGCLYIHDRANRCIKKIADDKVVLYIPTDTPEFNMFVNGLTLDAFGNLYVTDNDVTAKVHKYHWNRSVSR